MLLPLILDGPLCNIKLKCSINFSRFVLLCFFQTSNLLLFSFSLLQRLIDSLSLFEINLLTIGLMKQLLSRHCKDVTPQLSLVRKEIVFSFSHLKSTSNQNQRFVFQPFHQISLPRNPFLSSTDFTKSL